MVDFAKLKANRKSTFEKLSSELNKLNAPQENSSDDNRFWKPTVDKAGNGYAVIRFLPAPDEDMPFVRIWDHGFQGPGGWYIEKSLSTIGQKDPIGEYNSKLWATGIESNKTIVRKQKRRLTFISNIYVDKDPGNPENEGKVFLYRYGKKIFDKLNEAMHPQFPDEAPVNAFDLWDGANFLLKIRNVEGYRNYDKSELASPSPLFDNDEEIEKVYKQGHSLQAFLEPKNFKSYEELERILARALGNAPAKDKDVVEEKFTAPKQEKTAEAAKAPATKSAPWDADDDDDTSFFQKLSASDD